MVTPDAETPRQDLFTPVRLVRSFEDIALQIEVAVSSGRLTHGDRLPNERDLGSMFGVSRATLREALRLVEGAGIVEIRRGAGGGIYVCEPNADQVAQALEALLRFRRVTAVELGEFRGSFESETAYWAAKRATAEEIACLGEIADEYGRCARLPSTTWPQLVDLDVDFHEQVARASHNQIRVAIMFAIHGALRQVSLSIESVADISYRHIAAAELLGIAEAVSKRQPRAANQLMRRHVLRNSQAEVQASVSNHAER